MPRTTKATAATATTATTVSATLESAPGLLHLDEAQVIIDTDQNGRAYEPAVDDLVESIKTHGLIEPIVVTPDGDQYRVVAGFRRALAIKEINTTAGAKGKVPYSAVVRDIGSEDDALVINLTENVKRKTLSPVDEAAALEMAFEGKTGKQLANARKRMMEVFGRSKAWVSQQLKLNDLVDELKALVHSNQIAVATAYEFADLPPNDQRTLYKEMQGTLDQGAAKPESADATVPDKAKSDDKPTKRRVDKPTTPSADTRKAARDATGKVTKPTVKQIITYLTELRDTCDKDGWSWMMCSMLLQWFDQGKSPDDFLVTFLEVTRETVGATWSPAMSREDGMDALMEDIREQHTAQLAELEAKDKAKREAAEKRKAERDAKAQERQAAKDKKREETDKKRAEAEARKKAKADERVAKAKAKADKAKAAAKKAADKAREAAARAKAAAKPKPKKKAAKAAKKSAAKGTASAAAKAAAAVAARRGK